MNQEQLVLLTHYVRSFSDALMKLKAVFCTPSQGKDIFSITVTCSLLLYSTTVVFSPLALQKGYLGEFP